MDIKSELDSNQSVLLMMTSLDYNRNMVENLKALSGSSVLYITLSKTFDSLKNLFEKKGINTGNLVFIDAISKTMKKVKEVDNCYYVSSPGALTELSLVLTKFLKHDFDYLIFDSIDAMLTYQKEGTAIRFLSSIINKIKGTKTKAVFYDIGQVADSFTEKASTIVDAVVEAGGAKQSK